MAKQRAGDGWTFRPADFEEAMQPLISLLPAEQRFTVDLDKRKKGKTVTVVRGLVLSPDDFKKLGKALKTACGTGGTAKSGAVELQGDCRDRVKVWLRENGWGGE